jgi:hypothetical protein
MGFSQIGVIRIGFMALAIFSSMGDIYMAKSVGKDVRESIV